MSVAMSVAASDVALRRFRPEDAAWVIDRHAALYAVDEGYDASFRDLVAGIVAGFLAAHDPAREAGWIAEGKAGRLGSIFVVTETPEIAKLRLVLLEPQARGSGLASRMMDTALTFARTASYTRMRLWTHESHIAAGRLYARHGFHLVSSTPGHQFGQSVIDQIWERSL